jgi:hypothetical protein
MLINEFLFNIEFAMVFTLLHGFGDFIVPLMMEM